MAKGRLRVEFSAFFPMWGRLTPRQQAALSAAAFTRRVGKGEVMHSGDADCTGLLLMQSGQIRAFILSADGREITLYRLFERDLCLLSASCMMRSIQFDITIQAEKDTDLWVIPAEIYKRVMDSLRATGELYQRGYGGKVFRGDVAH